MSDTPRSSHKRLAYHSIEEAITEKRLRRLEKNRMSARECRRRKKENISTLQNQLASLEADNLELRLKLKVGDEAMEEEDKELAGLKERLQFMVSNGAGEGEILSAMDMLKTKFADYGRDRTSAAIYHIDQLERLLRPTMTTRTCMHALLSKDDKRALPSDFQVNGRNSELNLWDTLVQVLQITSQQEEQLACKVQIAQAMDSDLRDILELVSSLKNLLCTKNELLDEEMAQIQSILTPTQTAKFILWVSHNAACMHMLNELWSHVYEGTDDVDGSKGAETADLNS